MKREGDSMDPHCSFLVYEFVPFRVLICHLFENPTYPPWILPTSNSIESFKVGYYDFCFLFEYGTAVRNVIYRGRHNYCHLPDGI
jgi:hypothetical protein